jgi:hypothetical protein
MSAVAIDESDRLETSGALFGAFKKSCVEDDASISDYSGRS